jgi:8-oxo-dGTP diphosphatase
MTSPAVPADPAYGVLLRARSGSDVVVDLPLGHGQDPELLLNRAGWRIERPVSAVREGNGAVSIEYAVRAASPCSPPQRLIGPEPVVLRRRGVVGRDDGLELAEGEEPVRRQRVSAAVLVVAEVPAGVRDSLGRPGPGGRCVLATRYSGAALRWDGTWGLPGGGLDEAEHPAAAARREALEETGQDVVVGELAFVQSAHWVGRSPRGVAEDFHAVRLVYRGECAAPADVVVHDLGGTTSEAAWVRVDRAAQVDWAPGPAEQLRELGVLAD